MHICLHSTVTVGKLFGDCTLQKKISNLVSAAETADSDLIDGRVKPKTIKIDIYSFPAGRSP